MSLNKISIYIETNTKTEYRKYTIYKATLYLKTILLKRQCILKTECQNVKETFKEHFQFCFQMVYFHVLLLYCFVSKLSYYLLKNGQLPLLILWSRSSTVVHTYFPLYDCSLLLRSVHEQFLRTMWLYFLPFSLDLNLAEYIINRKM